ncbi:hypothetical protein [Photobacterium leiognathi]|uniref:hypothetical protein n=1 Tax=Photobacterium leiognathi TaxID=553611 RepID=UPI002981F7F1|nr:hypothetical protein [Photobacterium leiognathi]
MHKDFVTLPLLFLAIIALANLLSTFVSASVLHDVLRIFGYMLIALLTLNILSQIVSNWLSKQKWLHKWIHTKESQQI